MKITFNKSAPGAHGIALSEGRQIGTVVQVSTLGSQPAFNPGEPAVDSLGVVIQLVGGGTVAKKMRVSDHPMSALHQYLEATLPDPDLYGGDDPLPLTLGRPVAVEISMNGRFPRIESFHRPEDFELSGAPEPTLPWSLSRGGLLSSIARLTRSSASLTSSSRLVPWNIASGAGSGVDG